MKRGGFIKHSLIFVILAVVGGVATSYFVGTEWINTVKAAADTVVIFIQNLA